MIKRKTNFKNQVEPETQYLMDLIESKLKQEHKLELEDFTTISLSKTTQIPINETNYVSVTLF